ncbi:MAG: tRNA 2-thiouridine(34) synthase MnmA [Cyanobacteria bacterium P01_H01_bin.74]
MTNFIASPTKKIAVAMSGGVDSSVAAYLIRQAGYEAIGLTAWTLNGPGKCCNDALVNAGRVCETLGMTYDTVDLRAAFSHYVMDYYNKSYKTGLTPNPCVECNRFVKWELLVDYAVNTLGADYIATGHYALIHHHPEKEDPVSLYRSTDEHKDQTYMMARVYPHDLAKTIFPLGTMTKPEVVALAKSVDLPTAYSKESQDICFVLNGQANYMNGVFGKQTGNLVDYDTGKVVGQHEGHYRYTLGQRKGIGVGVGRPVYVVKIDVDSNTVYLGDQHHIEKTRFVVKEPNWLVQRFQSPEAYPFQSMVKIRYNSPPVLGTVEYAHQGELWVTLDTPQLAVTPGQIAAFYDENFQQLYGGGYIEAHLAQQTPTPEEWQEKAENLPDLHCQLA